MDLYAENILDHYRHPRKKEPLAGATAEHREVNHSCGDALSVQLIIENDVIAGIGWSGDGCAISQAGMSILSEELEGLTTEKILTFRKEDINELLGVPVGPRRFKCALLGLHTVKNAIRKARGEAPQSWLDTVEIAE